MLVFRELPFARCRCGAVYGSLEVDAPSLAPTDFRIADGAVVLGEAA